jgi:hypothetical protein
MNRFFAATPTLTLKARADRDVAVGMGFIPFAFAEAPANML